MEVNTQAVLEDLLEQNKQLTLQLSIARTIINQLQAQAQAPDEKTES
jgi:hypothetical protein